MLIELILAPWAALRGGKLFLWMDNCGAHKTDCLKPIFEKANVTVGLLPPNMTAVLQVLDLVVNGPLKAHIRRLRAKRLCDYFDIYKAEFKAEFEKEEAIRRMPKWEPPKPSMYECISDIIKLVGNEFAEDTFRKGIRSSFLNTGTMYDRNNQFAKYVHKNGIGSMPISPDALVKNNFVSAKGIFHMDYNDLVNDLHEMYDGGEDSDIE